MIIVSASPVIVKTDGSFAALDHTNNHPLHTFALEVEMNLREDYA